jgi:hypothetical protein
MSIVATPRIRELETPSGTAWPAIPRKTCVLYPETMRSVQTDQSTNPGSHGPTLAFPLHRSGCMETGVGGTSPATSRDAKVRVTRGSGRSARWH